MKTLRKYLLMFLLLTISFAQTAEDITLGKTYQLFSDILKENRSISVFLPSDYNNSGQKYPVMYVLDGYFLWTAGITDYLTFSGNIPPMIVVAIASTERDRDFTPTNAKNIEGEYIPTSGGAGNFLRFLEEELLPWVDKNYRTENFRLLAGHSMGGLFSTYAFLEKNNLFQAIFAVSPTLPWDNEYINSMADKKIISNPDRKVFYYLTMDSQGGLMPQAAEKMNNILTNKKMPYLRNYYKVYKNEDHISCFHISMYDGLRELYHKYKLDGSLIEKGDAAGIEKHYSDLTNEYGYKIVPALDWIDWIANWHFIMKRITEATQLYELADKYYPDNQLVIQKLAKCFEKNGNKEKEQYYKNRIKTEEQNK